MTLIRIDVAGRSRRARRLVFDDASTRTTAAAVVRILSLEAGDPRSPAELEPELLDVERAAVKERAAMVLGYRDRSVAELIEKLVDDGYPRETIDEVIARFGELSLLDDQRFATGWIRARRASGYGDDRIRRELRQKGVSDQVISGSFAESAEESADQIERASRLLSSSHLESQADARRAVARLLRKGFPMGVALAAVRRLQHYDDVE